MFVAAFAAVGVADLVKQTVEAAVRQEATFATLNKAVSNAGAANEVHGQTVDNLVKQQALLKGFSVSDLAGAFQQIVTVTHSSAEAFALLAKAQDLARGTGRNLAISALAIEKAYEGNATALTRFGIIIPKVTTDVDRLRAAHAAATDSGVTFNASENAAYAIQVRNATAADKLLTATAALNAEQARFGGQAAVAATGAAGGYDRLKQSVDQLAVSFGSGLTPGIAGGENALANWINALASSGSAANAAKIAGHDFGVVLHDIEDVARTVGPILGDVAKFTYQVVSAVGAPALLAVAGTFEGIKVATALAKDAQAAYDAVLLAGGATRVAQVTETQALTAALVANTAAMSANRSVVATTIPIYDAYGATLAEVAVGEQAVAAGAVEASTALSGGSFLGGLGALATGPAGIAIGLAALAGGIVYLTSKEQSWSDVNGALTSSVQALNQALQQQTNSSGTAAGASAKATKAASDAVATNIERLAGATQFYGTISGNLKQKLDDFVVSLDKQRQAFATTDPILAHDILLVEQLTTQLKGIPPEVNIQLLLNNQDPSAGIASVLSGLSGIETFLAGFSHLAGPAASSLQRGAPLTGYTEAQLAAAQAAYADTQNGKTHTVLTATAQLAITQLQQGIALATSQQQNLNQQMADAVAQGAIAVQQAVTQAQQSFITIGQGIASDIGTYIDAPLTLAGNALQLQADRLTAIQTGIVSGFAGQNAILDRETAQISLRAAQIALTRTRESLALPGGGTLSPDNTTALRQIDALIARTPARDRLSLQEFRDQLQTQIIAVQRASEGIAEAPTVARARETGRITERQALLRVAQDRATIEKASATASINNWAAEYETKRITLERFNSDVANLIRRDVGRLGNLAGVPGGYLLEQQLKGSLTGLGLQAQALAAGPQQLGAAFLPTITHPLTALQNEQKSIASIAHSDASTQATIATDMRNTLKLILGATKDIGGLRALPSLSRAQLAGAYREALHSLGGA